MGKRKEREGEGGGGGAKKKRPREPKVVTPDTGPTIGQQTSYIKNKQRRGQVLEELKHKKKVRPYGPTCCPQPSVSTHMGE